MTTLADARPPPETADHVYYDRSGLPDLDLFIRFELPMTGEVYDARGKLLIELAREDRRARTSRRPGEDVHEGWHASAADKTCVLLADSARRASVVPESCPAPGHRHA